VRERTVGAKYWLVVIAKSRLSLRPSADGHGSVRHWCRVAIPAFCTESSIELDRIRSVIAEVNKALSRSDAVALSRFFTADGTLRMGRLVATGRPAIVSAMERPRSDWSEVTPAFIETQSVEFVSGDVAIVDATQTQYGSLILKRSVPVMLLMKLDGKEWRILSMRLYAGPVVIGAGR